jgi:phage terminase large subunit
MTASDITTDNKKFEDEMVKEIESRSGNLTAELEREAQGYISPRDALDEKKSNTDTTIGESTTNDTITPFTAEEIIAKLDKEITDALDNVDETLRNSASPTDEEILKDPHGVKCEGFGKIGPV